MQVIETAADGLRREFSIVVGKADLDTRLAIRLEELKGKVRLKGFRPGKVPMNHLRRAYGKSVMAEIIQETVSESSQKAIEERSLRPAQQPKIELTSELENVADGKEDLVFSMTVELMPEFTPVDVTTLSLERLTADIDEADVASTLDRFAEQSRTYAPRADGETAREGDALTIDFEGRIDGTTFEGGKGDGVRLVIGAKRFIPGLEEGIIGAKAGDSREVNVTFPADYSTKTLAGKDAVFSIIVKDVASPEEVPVDDAFATKLGFESLDKLREAISNDIKANYGRASRAHMKRALLDVLDSGHKFELPRAMVDAEFDQIWRAVESELKREGKAATDEAESEEKLKDEYRIIAERRVRLGLVLSEIGRLNKLEISKDELSRAVVARARQYPGQEKQIVEFYQKNPAALAEIRAPLYEEKVVDFAIELARVTEKKVSKQDLFLDPDELIEKNKGDADARPAEAPANPGKKKSD